jgi:inhibitor of KinA
LSVRLVFAGDSAIVIEFEERIDPAVSARTAALADAIVTEHIPGVRDVVPTYRSVTVYFDPLHAEPVRLSALCRDLAGRITRGERASRDPVRIPVCYGGELGPDLPAVARFGGLAEDEVVRLHADATYRVMMLGFTPGFAYMGIVDTRIAAPRLETPRQRVPRGSVGIAKEQTGIYPSETPGGWQIIGRTPVRPFDLTRPDPFLLHSGDEVQFVPIAREDFDQLARAH